eukprot:gnl/TRDRNA2_/TRDRNA2_187341_c0_seq1.p1 gnl/TRDRNA2_/TRDRNA2_187341_c0~~gnl/TRDRNA2_/TRDRNA2_187341_c0_seq1.p1  ORF type:complete len:378 (-),score=72.52 gnl/TRDRNA2_/TRDRNA2_187341_c0_seq1:70-1203(-)
MAWAKIEDALAAFRRGESLIVVDSKDRKDECDLVFAADHATTQRMAFAIRHSSGIIYMAAEKDRLEHFGLHPATSHKSTERFGSNSYVSTTYLPGSTTGLSAADRTATAKALCNRSNPAEAFTKPGHMFPVVASPGGVLERPGHTEAAYDLCRLSGRTPVACLTELTHDDGTMVRGADALQLGQKHSILVITVDQLIEYRQAHPQFPNAPNPDSIPSIRGLDLPTLDGTGLRIGIVCARWNSVVTDSLVKAAKLALESCNVRDIIVEHVAGSYEIPSAAQVLLESGRLDGVICIGCLIKGESMHFEYINEAVTQGVMRLNLDYKVPVIYGILSVLNEDQAKARAGLDSAGHNSGKEWGITCVESCLLKRRYRKVARL